MSDEKVTLDKALGGLGRVIQKGKELAREERRPPSVPAQPAKVEPTPPGQPPPTSPPG